MTATNSLWIDGVRHHTCTNCETLKPIVSFTTRPGVNLDVVYQPCKSCSNNRRKAYYLKNLERERTRGRAYYARNKRHLQDYGRHKYQRNKEQRKSYQKAYRKSHAYKVTKFKTHLKRYGITMDEYFAMLALQDSKCAICGGSPKTKKGFCVDHDHVTGRFRGLLCATCNVGLGAFYDNTQTMDSAINYLRKNKSG